MNDILTSDDDVMFIDILRAEIISAIDYSNFRIDDPCNCGCCHDSHLVNQYEAEEFADKVITALFERLQKTIA